MISYKFCKCGKKIPTHLRMCETCKSKSKKLLNQNYDKFKRDLKSKEFYNSTKWRKLRKTYISEHPFCVKCGRFAKIIDHIVPIKQGGEKLNKENLQSLCLACHNEKTSKELK